MPTIRRTRFASLAFVVAALAMRLLYLLHRPFWFDELFTLWISRKSPAEILRTLRLDSGPPLFYLLEMPFVRLGEVFCSDAPSRALPFLAIAALFLAGCRRDTFGGPRFPVLLAASPLLFFHAAEARSYALLAALSFVLFLAVFRVRKRWAAAVLAATAALLLPWAHYLGAMVVAGSLLLCAVLRKRRFLAVQAAALIPFLAWAPIALRQPPAAIAWSGETFASSATGTLGVFGFWGRVPAYFSGLMVPAPFAGGILGALLLIFAGVAARRDRAVRDALLFAAFPLLLAGAACFFRPIWFAGRTEMAVLPVALWAFSRGARRSQPLRVLTAAGAAAGFVLIVASLADPPVPPPYAVSAAFVAARASKADVVVASDADYLPLRLASDRGALAAPLLGIPSPIETHPGWFQPGRIADAAGEASRLEGFLGGLPPRGHVFFAVPPDPAPRRLAEPYLSGTRVRIVRPPGGDAVAVVER